MKTPITIKAIRQHFTYAWWKYALLALLAIFGWNLLSAITFGLVGIFYAGPYQYQTNANLYLELSRTDRPTFEL